MNLGDNLVAIIIPNCRTPELAQRLIDHIDKFTKHPYVGILLNNPSEDITWEGQYTINVSIPIEMVGAYLMALTFADTLEQLKGISFFAYWSVLTSLEFLSDMDYLTPMIDILKNDSDAVMVSPEIEGTAWDTLHPQGHNDIIKAWGVDCNAVLWRADWFNSIGRYDIKMFYGWGGAMESCWMARRDGKGIYVHHGLKTKKHDGIAEEMGRRTMSRIERNTKAAKNMYEILEPRYGKNFLHKLGWEYRGE